MRATQPRVVLNLDFDAEDLAQHSRVQHFPGCAHRNDAPLVQHVQSIAIGGSQVEIVQDEDRRQAERAHQIQDLDLVAHVQVVGRLVQDQHTGLLGQRAGDQYALLLTTGSVLNVRAANSAMPTLASASATIRSSSAVSR